MLIKQLVKAAGITAGMVLAGYTAQCQDKSLPKDLYLAAAIPDSLKQDAHKVIRYAQEEVKVSAPGRMVVKVHQITTVLDDKGDDAGQMVLFYDRKFSSVNAAQMLIYNAEGKLIKKYSKSDMYDRSAVDGISIITDSRLMALRHEIATYPSTVEIYYETDRNSYLDLSEWEVQPKETAVQSATYKISVVPGVNFRYKEKNIRLAPQKETQGNYEVYTWQVKNLKALTPEDDVPGWSVAPRIAFAANKFEFNGIPGDISTWQNYGKWIQGLNADVCTLSPQRAEAVKQMTAHLKTEQEKARFLYNYLQRNMRYVSIQLGIGGLKPFPAMFVDEKKYGDCKALSNYMYALLKAVDIRSHYALIRAGANGEPADADFPADPFNHIVLCIPFKGDTTWLECTSNTQPYGKLGTFTENRNALLITEDGGKLVNTPKSTDDDNQFNSQVLVKLDANGGATAKVKILSTGEYRDLFVSGLPTINQSKQKEYLIRSLNFRQPSFFDIKAKSDSAGVSEANFELEYDNFTEVAAGNKKFYRPRVFDLWQLTLPVVDKRRGDYYFEHPMQKSCVTVISLPDGYEADAIPENVSLKFSYGTYDASYKYDAAKNEVTSTVKFHMKKHVIPAAKYAEMQQYMDNIAKAQNKKLVIHKKA
jgi:transglutaminase-like putative cysteine protease